MVIITTITAAAEPTNKWDGGRVRRGEVGLPSPVLGVRVSPPPREICENIGADGCNLELKISSLIFKQKHSNVHQLPTSKLPSLTTDFSQLSFSN